MKFEVNDSEASEGRNVSSSRSGCISLLPGLPKMRGQCYSNKQGSLDNVGSNKDSKPLVHLVRESTSFRV